MYLARVEAENFRIFGSRETGDHLKLDLDPGLNLIVGENDSGKTCVIDAIRLALGTAPNEYFFLSAEDFHCRHGVRATSLAIAVELRNLSEAEAAAFLEFVEFTEAQGCGPEFRLKITLTAQRDESIKKNSRRSPIRWEIRAGSGTEGQRFEGPVRDLLRATYLKPLRDAVGELAAKKGSRLSQILQSYPQLKGQEVNDWDPVHNGDIPHTLIGIARRAEDTIRDSEVVRRAESNLNETYLKRFSIGPSPLTGRIGMAAQELKQLLERMELTLAGHEPGATRGLGHHNVLFMATELLSLERDDDPCLPLVLIEEPESHLHPQLQLRLVEFFRDQKVTAVGSTSLQTILTSHSPNIASKVGLRHITMMSSGKAFSLKPGATRLDGADYAFLERFLDVTKAEFLFARGLMIVEGPSEAILLPTIAELIGLSLGSNGVSVIAVGSVGLFRYSRILQRADASVLPVHVACLADRDIPPPEARSYLSVGRRTEEDLTIEQKEAAVASKTSTDGGGVKTFVSDSWTFEYDLSLKGLAREMHAATTLAAKSRDKRAALTSAEWRSCVRKAFKEHRIWIGRNDSTVTIAVSVYKAFLQKKASKTEAAQYLAALLTRLACRSDFKVRDRLPDYLVRAIEYATSASGLDLPDAASKPTAGNAPP